MNKPTNAFSVTLREMRVRSKLTQSQADEILGTCKGQVAAWESGRNTPHVLTQEAALARLSAHERGAEAAVDSPQATLDSGTLRRLRRAIIQGRAREAIDNKSAEEWAKEWGRPARIRRGSTLVLVRLGDLLALVKTYESNEPRAEQKQASD